MAYFRLFVECFTASAPWFSGPFLKVTPCFVLSFTVVSIVPTISRFGSAMSHLTTLMSLGASVHPTYLDCVVGQQTQQRGPDVPLPINLSQEDVERLPGYLGNLIPPVCPGSASGRCPSWASLKHLPMEASYPDVWITSFSSSQSGAATLASVSRWMIFSHYLK